MILNRCYDKSVLQNAASFFVALCLDNSNFIYLGSHTVKECQDILNGYFYLKLYIYTLYEILGVREFMLS